MRSKSRPKRKWKALEPIGRPLLRISRASTRRFERLEDRRLLASDLNFSLLATDLRSALSTMQTSIATAVNQAPSIPIIGASLGNNPGLTQAIGSKANSLQSGFQAVASDISANPAASDSIVTGYVQSELASVATNILVTPDINADGTWRFEMQLHQDLAVATVHPQFDAGLGSYLSVSGGGSIDLKVGMDYLLQFTFDPTTSAIALESTNLSTIDSSLPNAPLAIEISAAPSAGFSLEGQLAGLLHLSATDEGTQFTGTYGVSIISPSQVSVSLAASAHVGLHATLDFGSGDLPFDPKITSDLHLDWLLSGTTLASGIDGTTFGSLGNIGFDNVKLDAGSFFGGYVESMIKNIQYFTKPLEPVVDVLTTEIPGLSDIGIHASLLTLLDPNGSSDALAALDTIKQLNSLDVNSLNGSGQIDFGSFTIGDEIRSTGPSIASSSVASDVMQQADAAAGNTLDQLGENNSIDGIQFPILTDPLHNVFGLLTGQNATLFSFKLPDFSFPFAAEIPVIAIEPFAGLFLDVKLLVTMNLGMGYDTAGIKEFVQDVKMGTTDASKLSADLLDGFYLDNGTHTAQFQDYPDLVVHNTGIEISGGVTLAAKAIVLKVEGGVFADIDLHLDPSLDDPGTSQVRISKVAEELSNGTIPFTATGSIFVSADIEIVIPAPFEDITLAHVNLAHITLLTFDVSHQVPTESDGHTIYINESTSDQTVHVQMEQLAPDTFGVAPPNLGDLLTGSGNFKGYYFDNPDTSDTKAYIEAIVVSYSDHTETYPVAYFHHVDGNLVGLNLEQRYVDADFPGLPEVKVGVFKTVGGGVIDDLFTPIHYNLIATVPPPSNPLNDILGIGKQTISVGDIYGDATGAPVNAVLIGGGDDDTLEYDGHGQAVLIGGDGNNSLRAFNNSARAVYVFGNTIDPSVFNVNTINFAMPSAIQDEIQSSVQSPSDPPEHTSDVLAGAGSSVFLGGGPWDNFFEGPGTATFNGGAGKNDFRVEAKLTDPSIPFVPGSLIDNPSADNTVIIDRNGVQDATHDSVILRADSGLLHITGNVTDLTLHNHEALAISMAGGTLDVGDLSSLGPVDFLVNRGSTSAPPTTAIFDTPPAGLTNPLYIVQHGPVDPVQNPNLIDLDLLQGADGSFAGANVEMIGFTRFDNLDVKLRGGQVNIGDLNGTGMGLVKIDGSVRAADSTAVDDISITTHPENTSLAPDPNSNILVRLEDSTTPYDVEIDDDRPQDITTLIVPTQDLSNLATVDASEMEGTLHIDVGGATLTLLQVAENMTVIVAGTDQANPAEVTVGDSKLSHIESNVSVTGAELTIDNSTNAAPHIFTMTSNSYTGWSIPNSTFEPTIFLGNALSPLVGTMTLRTAAGDRFDIEGTPPKVNTLVFDNTSVVRNAIFVVAATSNMIINGDFDLYLGERLEPDGTSEREKHLTPISNVKIILNFMTVISGYASTIFDGDLDSGVTKYEIDGLGNLHIVNQTVGLDVTINGYRTQDQVYVYLPGGTVNANLEYTSPGTIYLDGQARLAGFNATDGNNVTIQDRYGQTQLNPLSRNNSVLENFNNVYLLGSIPQDSLTVNVPTNVVMTSSIPNSFNIANNPQSHYEIASTSSDIDWTSGTDSHALVNGNPAIVSWLSGPRGEFFPFMNVEPGDWASVFAPGQGNGTPPDPFTQQPYGIVLPYVDRETTVTYIAVNNGVVTESASSGMARYWLVNPNPTAVNNDVNLDASQLRGSLQFNVTGPDYNYLSQLEHDSFKENVTESMLFDGDFYTWGTPYDIMRMAFGQSNIVISKVNPQLSVTAYSANEPFTFSTGIANQAYASVDQTLATPFPLTTVTVGTGTLANIQGSISVHDVFLKDVNDRQGTQAGNVILTGSMLSNWSTISGSIPTLTFDTLRGALTISGSTVDQFDVEDTPDSAYQTTIENFATTGTAPGVYVMGKTVMPLYIDGHFSVYAGRRLNADGSVTDVGKVDNLFNSSDTFALTGGIIQGGGFQTLAGNNPVTGSLIIVPGETIQAYINKLTSQTTTQLPLPLFDNYVGDGQGILVFDASNDVYNPGQGGVSGAEEGITANPNYPTEADFRYRTMGDVIWGSNIQMYDYAPAYNGAAGAALGRPAPTEIINNPVTGEIHYFTNPNATNGWQQVVVGATLGAVEIVGDDQFTRVDLDPTYSKSIATIYNIQSPGLLPGWGAASGGGDNLLGTIIGDVTVRHAGLTIHADVAGSTAPASLPQIVLTDTQITGIAGGTIHFSNLTQSYSQATANAGTFANQFPGLVVRMPTYGGVSVRVQNTPVGTTTELNTETNGINDLTVLGTTGTLEMANVTFGSGGNGEYTNFAANSVTIGNGNVSAIAGAIYLGAASLPGHVTIDDRSDATSRHATFMPVPSTAFFAFAGLSPAAININSSLTLSALDVYGAAASSYSFQWAPQGTRLFAGAGSSVELNQSAFFSYIAPVSVFGAASVLIDPQRNPTFQSGFTVNVAPDPTRPTDTTNLTIDFTKIPVNVLTLGSVGSGIYALFGNSGTTQAVAYQGSTTHLILLLYSQATANSLPVTDTASGGTTISPGDYALNIQGTSGPLTIEQGGTGTVTLGKNGGLAGILGAVSVLANNSALPVVPLTIDDSADSSSKTVTLSQDGSGNTQISGELASPIQITGSQFIFNLKGGSGNNKLVAPDIVDIWQVAGANSGVLNRTTTFSGFSNLQSGNQNDNIFFKPGGSLGGNLDGGPGTDTLYYQAGMLTGSDVINLPAHIAPRVSGQALNIESSNTFGVLTISNPGQLIVQVDAPMTPVTITSTGGSGAKTFSATGLPTGVAINPSTGVISGTNTTDFYAATVMVTVTDDTGSVSASFAWNTSSGLILTTPPNQSSQVSQIINLPIRTSYTYGGTLTYTATSLPNGLSINSQTGLISGTIADGAQTSSPYSVFLKATDGTNSAFGFFNWTVLKSFAVVNPGTQLFPESLPVNLQMQAVNGSGPITYSASNLPASLSIDPHTGLISGILADYANSSGNFVNFSVTVFANDTHQTVSTAFTFGTEPGFQVTGVYDQTDRSGDVVDNFLGAFNADGNATVTTSVSGLPAGLTYNNSTHLITGTIAANADTASPYTVTVTFNNQTFGYTASESFHWTVTPAIVMASPGDQNSILGDVVDVPIAVTEQFGQPITFSAGSQLPLGLSVDPNTGTISGTIGPQLNSSSDFTIDIHATDGTVDGDLKIDWHIGQTTANVAEIYDPTSGGTVTLTSPVGTILNAQIDSEESSNDSANIWSFSLGYLTLSVQGVAPGGSASVEMHSSTLINPTDYFVDGPTPANSDYHWYDFLYQHPTDTDDASTTGAEFLPNDDIVLHLVDGARGDADLTADGQINVNLNGPTSLALSAHIVGAPATWPIGAPLTLGSEIGGSAALGASLHWQAFYTPDFENYINLPNGADSTYTLNPQEAGFYYVYLTATSADGTVSATDYNFHLNVPATTAGTPPIGEFAIAGIPSDIVAGHSISGTILAEDANGNSLEGYTGSISIRISDSQNNTIDTISRNFDPSTFTFGPISLQNTGNSPTTDTITITAGNTTVSLPIVVHPVSRFVSTQVSLAVDAHTPFGVSFIAEDDRSVFDSDYSGSAKVTYVDNQGEHDLSGGFQAVSGGVVTFQNVVLPSGGVYHLQATSADGKVVGSFFVDSQVIDLSARVMNTADSGAGSLRQALLDAAADTSGEQHTIQFALPTGPQTITLQSPLPTPTDPLMLTLDATQKVTIVGSSPTAWNNTQSFTLSGVGSLTFVGVIDGTGNLVVDAGSNLTADSIVQNSLSIGAGATVTIAPSGGSMNASTATATVSTTDVAATSAPSQVALARLAAVRAQRLAALLLAESSVSTDIATAPIEVAPTAVANTTDAIAPALTIGPAVSILSSKTPIEASVAATIIPPTITLTNNSLAKADVSSSVSRLTVKIEPPSPQRQSSRSSAGQSASLLTHVTFDQLFHQIPSDLTSNLSITAWNWQDVSDSPATSRVWSATAFAGDGASSNDSPRTSLGAGGLDPNAVREAIDTIFATDEDVAWRFDDSRWALLADGASNSDHSRRVESFVR